MAIGDSIIVKADELEIVARQVEHNPPDGLVRLEAREAGLFAEWTSAGARTRVFPPETHAIGEEELPDHGQMRRLALETSLRLIDESAHGQTDGITVAAELGYPENSPGARRLYDAFMALKQEGSLDCAMGGGMALPAIIRR